MYVTSHRPHAAVIYTFSICCRISSVFKYHPHFIFGNFRLGMNEGAILFFSGSKESWEYMMTGALFYSFFLTTYLNSLFILKVIAMGTE